MGGAVTKPSYNKTYRKKLLKRMNYASEKESPASPAAACIVYTVQYIYWETNSEECTMHLRAQISPCQSMGFIKVYISTTPWSTKCNFLKLVKY